VDVTGVPPGLRRDAAGLVVEREDAGKDVAAGRGAGPDVGRRGNVCPKPAATNKRFVTGANSLRRTKAMWFEVAGSARVPSASKTRRATRSPSSRVSLK